MISETCLLNKNKSCGNQNLCCLYYKIALNISLNSFERDFRTTSTYKIIRNKNQTCHIIAKSLLIGSP